MSDEEQPQFTPREIRMAQLGLELRASIRLIARAIAAFIVAPFVYFLIPNHYAWVFALVFALAGVAYLALGLRKRRAADRGLLALDAEESKSN